ncbi:MAG: hypothetical protein ABIP94_21105 [Planctomycetota bacterium]
MRLTAEGAIGEVYNGPGTPGWQAAGKAARNGQRMIGVGKLRTLMGEVAPSDRIEALR